MLFNSNRIVERTTSEEKARRKRCLLIYREYYIRILYPIYTRTEVVVPFYPTITTGIPTILPHHYLWLYHFTPPIPDMGLEIGFIFRSFYWVG